MVSGRRHKSFYATKYASSHPLTTNELFQIIEQEYILVQVKMRRRCGEKARIAIIQPRTKSESAPDKLAEFAQAMRVLHGDLIVTHYGGPKFLGIYVADVWDNQVTLIPAWEEGTNEGVITMKITREIEDPLEFYSREIFEARGPRGTIKYIELSPTIHGECLCKAGCDRYRLVSEDQTWLWCDNGTEYDILAPIKKNQDETTATEEKDAQNDIVPEIVRDSGLLVRSGPGPEPSPNSVCICEQFACMRVSPTEAASVLRTRIENAFPKQ